jgi:hypothetical protein
LGHPSVLLMQATENRDGHGLSNRADGTAERGVLLEREMGTEAIEIVSVGPQDPAKVRFVQDDDVVQAFSPD